MDSWTGQTLLGRYKVGRQLGQGGMARVYEADDLRREGWKVAVKHPLRADAFPPSGLDEKDLRHRFQSEVKKLIALGVMPGVVRIEDQGEHEGTPFYVLDYMAGGSLHDRLKKGPQALNEVLAWAKPIAKALDRLHARTPVMIHRDVKPGNILFDAEDQAHLSDFGIVKELNAAWATTGVNTSIGTAGYSAPEQYIPDADIDGRTDQYSLAASMYHALTGRPPEYVTTGGSAAPGGKRITGKRLKPVHESAGHVPAAAGAAIAKALSRDQDDRFDTCAEMVAAFEAGLVAWPAATGNGSTVLHPEQPASARPRWRRALVVALALALLGGGGFASFKALSKGGGEEARDRTYAEFVTAHHIPPAAASRLRKAIETNDQAGLAAAVRETGLPMSTVAELAALLKPDAAAPPAGSPDPAARATPLGPRPTPPEEHPKPSEAAATQPEAPKKEPWEAPLTEAEAAMAKDDGEAARAALARAEESGVPISRGQPVREFLLAWDAEPTLTIDSPTDNGQVMAMSPGLWRIAVRGSLREGRSHDRVYVDDKEVRVGIGSFSTTVERTMAGADRIRVAVRYGTAGRWDSSVGVVLLLPHAADGMIHFIDDAHGFSVRCPAALTPRVPDRTFDIIEFKASSADLPDLEVLLFPSEEGIAKDVDRLLTYYREERKGVASQEQTTVAGVPALLVTAHYVEQGVERTVLCGVVARGEEIFRLRGVMARTAENRGVPVFHAFLNSFAMSSGAKSPAATPAPAPAPAPSPATPSPVAAVPEWAKVSKEQIAEAERLKVPVAFEEPTTGMRFVLIPAGTFSMGSPPDEPDRTDSETQHRVTLTKPFYLQNTEVSAAQFRRWQPQHSVRRAGEGANWPRGTLPLDEALQPVVDVSYTKALEFAVWVGQTRDGRRYRLPSEAEWEWACRAGSTGPWWWGRDESRIPEFANVADRTWIRATWADLERDNYLGTFGFAVADGQAVSAPVGSFKPNPWGLQDMLGNVWEWCADWANEYSEAAQTDPLVTVPTPGRSPLAVGLNGSTLGYVPPLGPVRAIRGGCWAERRFSIRAAARAGWEPDSGLDVLGFRLAIDAK